MAETTKIKNQNKDSPRNRSAKKPVDSRTAKAKVTAKKSAKKVASAPRKRGRPPVPVSQVIANEICDWISSGRTLRDYCRQEGKPHFNTVYDWIDKDSDFAMRFARARDRGEEVISQECLAIADDGTNDYMETVTDAGLAYRLNGEHVQRSKLRIETRLKLLARWNPKKWGEKVDVNHGGQAENPFSVLLQQVDGTSLPIKGDE